MVEQEASDFVRFWSEPHGTVLEWGSVGRVMEEVCREHVITELFFGRGYADDIFRLIIVIEDEMIIFIVSL